MIISVARCRRVPRCTWVKVPSLALPSRGTWRVDQPCRVQLDDPQYAMLPNKPMPCQCAQARKSHREGRARKKSPFPTSRRFPPFPLYHQHGLGMTACSPGLRSGDFFSCICMFANVCVPEAGVAFYPSPSLPVPPRVRAGIAVANGGPAAAMQRAAHVRARCQGRAKGNCLSALQPCFVIPSFM